VEVEGPGSKVEDFWSERYFTSHISGKIFLCNNKLTIKNVSLISFRGYSTTFVRHLDVLTKFQKRFWAPFFGTM
jgi:hypothetical protein